VRCNRLVKGKKVRIALAALTVLFFSAFGFGQSPSRTPTRAPTPEFQQDFRPQISGLPVPKPFYPKLNLQAALKIVERHLKKEKIDLSYFYLAESKLILFGEGKVQERRWLFTWEFARAFGLTMQYSVSMDGKVMRHPSM
jgi:hypothetical protein